MSTTTPQLPAAVGTFTQLLSSTRRGARLARLLAAEQRRAWPVAPGVTERAEQIVAELVANAALHGRVPGRDFRLDILPDAFPWVCFLPESDLPAFAVELVDTMRAADSVGNNASVAQMLIAWQHTAEVYSDRELLAALTRDHGEDYGPAPDLRGVA